jgi:lysozyme
MSDQGIDALLKKFEGCKLKAYKDPVGIWTIGYGHTSAAGEPDVTEGLTITQDEAEEILKRDLVKYEKPVADMVKVPLSQHQFDVLVDFAYNAGVGNLKSSTLLKRVNAGDFDAVPNELMKWTKAKGKELPGLVRRRRAESEWWRDLNNKPVVEEDQRVEPDPVPVKTITESKQANGAVVLGALGSVGAAKEVMTQVQEANGLFGSALAMAQDMNFLIMVAVVGIGAAIWYWRKQNLEKHGI